MKATTKKWAATLLLAAAANTAFAASGHFEQGREAFKAGDYELALKNFNLAWGEGNNTATLAYNRAVTYYKLGQLEPAKTAFSSLLVNTQWVHLARYNLGRIAEQEGNMQKAYLWYIKVDERANNTRLQRLAQSRADALKDYAPASSKPAPPAPKTTAVLLSLGYALDDNATSLAEELSSQASDASDTYFRMFGYGHHYLTGEKNNGVKLYGLAQMRRFQTFNSYDTTVLGVGATYETKADDVDLDFGARLTNIATSAGPLANQISFITNAAKPIGPGRLQADYQASYYSTDEGYAHLDGWQHQAKLTWQQKFGRVVVAPGFRWETNFRANKQLEATDDRGERFYSYSPTSVGLYANIRWELNAKWRLYSKFNWANITHSEENIHKDIGGEEKQQTRETTRTDYLLGARYKLRDNWAVKTEYSHTGASDVFDLYSYDKNVFALKLEYSWE
ncbi:outer membrane beta-barrel protein [Saccharophagus degradans]|uniref:outer membrane beta-barrel protein n=1 Tax=Saccharophagus degradans TaxID=86304 RepID=UPI001C088659|nr:outer membrane beta-barrel protein [Saccharophagus degradans]